VSRGRIERLVEVKRFQPAARRRDEGKDRHSLLSRIFVDGVTEACA
jgi:hypothetical protein